MKAAYVVEPGPVESLIYGELPDPVAGQGQVLVAVRAVTVNHVDTFVRSGAYPIALPSPFIVGRDMVGEVVALGSGVERFAIGDRVWANNQGYAGRQGTFAELLAVDADLLYPLPDDAEITTAVALLHSLLTVVLGMLGKAQLKAGETLFLRGGSGSVGSAAIQVAKAMGCRVLSTAGSEANAEQCRQLGADEVILYHQQSLADALEELSPEGVNVYWDMAPQPDLRLAADHTARRGRILLNSGLTCVSELPVGRFYTRNLSLFGFTVTDLSRSELAHWSEVINGYLPSLKAQLGPVLPLSQTAEAHRLVETGRATAKVVLVPG